MFPSVKRKVQKCYCSVLVKLNILIFFNGLFTVKKKNTENITGKGREISCRWARFTM